MASSFFRLFNCRRYNPLLSFCFLSELHPVYVPALKLSVSALSLLRLLSPAVFADPALPRCRLFLLLFCYFYLRLSSLFSFNSFLAELIYRFLFASVLVFSCASLFLSY